MRRSSQTAGVPPIASTIESKAGGAIDTLVHPFRNRQYVATGDSRPLAILARVCLRSPSSHRDLQRHSGHWLWCDVCRSTDPRDRRTRTSALVRYEGHSVLIDTATELRAQALANDVRRVDAVLMTHAHADHTGASTISALQRVAGSAYPGLCGSRHGIDAPRAICLYLHRPFPVLWWQTGSAAARDRRPFDSSARRSSRFRCYMGDCQSPAFGLAIWPTSLMPKRYLPRRLTSCAIWTCSS